MWLMFSTSDLFWKLVPTVGGIIVITKCKLIELFLYPLYIVVVCKYICGAFSGQELLTRQSNKVCILCIFKIQNTVFVFKCIFYTVFCNCI